MNILCFGGGAIGSYIGGSLGLAGNQIVYVERASSAERLKANGIRIHKINGETAELKNIQAFDQAEEALNFCSYDLAIMAVKSFNTEDVLNSIRPFKTKLPPFMSLQNGVENEEKIAGLVGRENVIPVSVCTAISRGEAGEIRVEKLRGIGIADGLAFSKPLYEACKAAELKPGLCSNGQNMKWSKMISNLLSNAASAILDMTPAEVFSNPISYDLEVRQIREALSVMKAMNISPINIPGVPVSLLCWIMMKLPENISRPLIQKSVGSGRGGKMPSFYIDLHAGSKQSEVEYLNGAVVRAAKKFGQSVPVNQCYCETLEALAAGTLPLDTYQHDPEKLRKACLPAFDRPDAI